MKKLNPKHVKEICRIASESPHYKMIGMELTDLGPQCSEVRLEIEERHLQMMNVAHGGLLATMVDTAGFWSLYASLESGNDGLTTVELSVNYLCPTRIGPLVATGRQIKMGKKLGFAEAIVRDAEGTALVHGTGTFMVLKDKAFGVSIEEYPKFIN